MASTSIETKLHKIAFALGIVQGLAYAILAIICIALHNQDVKYLTAESYMETVNANIYIVFIAPQDLVVYYFSYALTSNVFTGFAWIFLILNLGWVGLSVDGIRRGGGVILPKYLKCWSAITLCVCLWDFITVCIIGSDYAKCMDYALNNIATQATCANVFLSVLVIVAKGFVLWVVNLIFAIILLKMGLNQKKGQVYQQPIQFAQPPQAPMMGFQQYPTNQVNMYSAQPSRPRPTPHVMQAPQNITQNMNQNMNQNINQNMNQSTNQNVNRNQFEYPVHIPDPDYHYTQQSASPGRH